MSERSSWRTCAASSCSDSTALRLSSATRRAPVASTARPTIVATSSRLYGAVPPSARTTGLASTNRHRPSRSQAATSKPSVARLARSALGRLLQGHEDTGLAAAHALGQELPGQHGLRAAGLTGEHGRAALRQAAHRDVVEAVDAGLELADRRALLAAVAPQRGSQVLLQVVLARPSRGAGLRRCGPRRAAARTTRSCRRPGAAPGRSAPPGRSPGRGPSRPRDRRTGAARAGRESSSWTVTSTDRSATVMPTSRAVRACSTALVTSSLVSSTRTSAVSSGSGGACSRTKARAERTRRGTGSRCRCCIESTWSSSASTPRGSTR